MAARRLLARDSRPRRRSGPPRPPAVVTDRHHPPPPPAEATRRLHPAPVFPDVARSAAGTGVRTRGAPGSGRLGRGARVGAWIARSAVGRRSGGCGEGAAVSAAWTDLGPCAPRFRENRSKKFETARFWPVLPDGSAQIGQGAGRLDTRRRVSGRGLIASARRPPERCAALTPSISPRRYHPVRAKVSSSSIILVIAALVPANRSLRTIAASSM